MLNKKEIPSKKSNGIWRLGITLTPDADIELQKAREFNPPKSSHKKGEDDNGNML